MTGLLQELMDFGGRGALVGAIVFLRVGAAMALLPGFGERSVPARVRLALAFAFTLIVAPGAATGPLPESFGLTFALRLLATETLAGLLIGIVLRLMILALEIAGAVAAQSTSLAQLFPGAAEPQPVVSHILVWAGLALAMMAGLHIRLCEIFLASYSILPVGGVPAATVMKAWALGHIGGAFSLAVQIAAPFVAISFLYNVALGLINRAVPQLMVAFIGAPAIALTSMLLLILALPTGLAIWSQAFSALLSDPFGSAP
jgi:flagellar biosynthetic protein FliR